MNITRIDELKTEANALHEQRKIITQKLIDSFRESIKLVFENYPKLKSFSIYVNNHEFNDGAETSFNVHYDEYSMFLKLEDSTEEFSKEEYKKLYDIFKTFDKFDIFETMFGNSHERVNFKRAKYIK